MRLIDADRLLEEKRIQTYYHLPNGDTAIPIIDIEHAPTVELNKRWIPVSVKLPEKRQDVIVTVNDGMIYTDTDEWIGTGFFAYGHNVVAWQSLPDPWKEEQ